MLCAVQFQTYEDVSVLTVIIVNYTFMSCGRPAVWIVPPVVTSIQDQ